MLSNEIYQFNSGWYLNNTLGLIYLSVNPDIRKAGIDPFIHYIQHGKREGRKYNNDKA